MAPQSTPLTYEHVHSHSALISKARGLLKVERAHTDRYENKSCFTTSNKHRSQLLLCHIWSSREDVAHANIYRLMTKHADTASLSHDTQNDSVVGKIKTISHHKTGLGFPVLIHKLLFDQLILHLSSSSNSTLSRASCTLDFLNFLLAWSIKTRREC